MTRTGFLSTAQVEDFLAFVPPDVRDIVLEVRSIVAGASPEATETVLWGALSYHDPAKGGRVKGAICAIEITKPGVEISFIHGVRLEDPDHLLQGDRLSKRHMHIASFDAAPWDAIRRLTEAAAALDPSTFGPTEAGRARGKWPADRADDP